MYSLDHSINWIKQYNTTKMNKTIKKKLNTKEL